MHGIIWRRVFYLKLDVQGQGDGRILAVDIQGRWGREVGLEDWTIFMDVICVSSLKHSSPIILRKSVLAFSFLFFFSVWVFFYEYLRFTGNLRKGMATSLTLLYHIHPLHKHLHFSRVIAAVNLPPRIAGSWIQTGKLWFPNASH